MSGTSRSPTSSGPTDPFAPCGVSGLLRIAPAARRGPLEGARMLLVDNGKLGTGYGPYAEIAAVLQEAIPGQWSRRAEDLLRVGDDAVAALADRCTAAGLPRAAVLALADAGVSMQTALLAIELERRGVPTVVLATPLGAGLADAILASHAPGLRSVVVETVRTDTPARLRGLLAERLPAIRAALTTPPAGAPGVEPGGAANADAPAERRQAWERAADAVADFQVWAASQGIGDGLPLLPPQARVIARLLAQVPDDPDTVIYGPALTSGRLLRVRDAAVNAAMTGCPPIAFPVVVAALRAVAQPAYRLSQAAITTHPSGNAIVFAGADPSRFGMTAGPGCLGPGAGANPAIGRAVALAIQHVFGARPGGADLTTFGSPAEFSYCLAERCEANPWPSIAGDFGDGAPGVLVMKAEAPRNVLEHLAMTPRGLCEALAGAAISICSNNAHIPGDLLVLINPEHAGILADAGWSRGDVAEAIHHLARLPRAAVSGRCIVPARPKAMELLDPVPVTRSPADVHIVVAGGHSPQSMVALPWGYSRACWQPVSATEGADHDRA